MSQLRLTDFPPELEPPPIPTPMPTHGLTLRPYQEEAYNAWMERGRRGVVIAPTGTGKTVIASHAIKTTCVPTLVVVPTERILKTWLLALKRFDLSGTAFYGEEKTLSTLTVSIYNSVVRHPEILQHFQFIVLDEVHHVAAEVFSQILSRIDGKSVMALTATLKRMDGRHREILARLPVVYCLDLKTAIQNNYVAPINIYPIPAPLTETEKKLYTDLQRKIFNLKQRLNVMREDPDPQLEKALKILLNRRRQFLSHIPSKRSKVLEILQTREADADKVIVFSESIESIERLKVFLNSHGVSAETYHSGKPEAVRDAVFNDWGKRFKVLLAVRALDEGVDVPEVGVGIVIASGKSVRQLVQRQGRLIRPRQGKTARIYVVFASGTYEYEIFLKLKGIVEGWVRLY